MIKPPRLGSGILRGLCIVGIVAPAVPGAEALRADEQPRSLDPRITIELFAEDPQIVTPVGIDVDHQGRVWAIESNTHFRPDDYDGHPSDRLLVMTDTSGDGRADRIVPFADGFTHAMSVAVRPAWLGRRMFPTEEDDAGEKTGAVGDLLTVFVATRSEILLLEDTSGDLKADRRTRLVHLDTPGNYPHNGLAGFAFDALGWMYVGFGENLGAPYTIIGSDGTTLSGGGEGGHIYRCRPDGSELSLWATGFWNPFDSCVDAFGRLFTVDNDPDSRPPCRLLHVVEGGDYGYRFRNGRKGLHPFTSWNGEIPGTLPMVAGTGEAPSGIVAYESDGLPDEYVGNLLTTSWGDHRIERFRLEPRGTSFESLAEPLIVGGENFRPVGLAVAPDGSLYCTDWVLRDYTLHGKGRVWRISADAVPNRQVVDLRDIDAAPIEKRLELLSSARLEVRRAAARSLAESPEGRIGLLEQNRTQDKPKRLRIEAYWAVLHRAMQEPHPMELLEAVPRVLNQVGGRTDFVGDEVWTAAAWERSRLTEDSPFVVRRASAAVPGPTRFDAVTEDRTFHLAARAGRKPSDGLPYPFNSQNFEAYLEDPYWFSAELGVLARAREASQFDVWWKAARSMNGRAQALLVLAARHYDPPLTSLLPEFLAASAAEPRRAAVQWVAEEGLHDLRPQVEAVLHGEPMTTDLFLATVAALEMLDGRDPAAFDGTPAAKYVVPLVRDDRRSPAVRAQALRLVDPADPELDAPLLSRLLQSDDPALRLEAVRTLHGAPWPESSALLTEIAADERQDHTLRLEAVAGLAGKIGPLPGDHPARATLRELLEAGSSFAGEAIRAFRGRLEGDAASRSAVRAFGEHLVHTGAGDATIAEWAGQVAMTLGPDAEDLPEIVRQRLSARPAGVVAWRALLLGGGTQAAPGSNPAAPPPAENAAPAGDAERGSRVFFHPNGPGCAKCHTVHGRGGRVGPDLSGIGRALSREKLVESILEPNNEIAPQYVAWTFETADGRVYTGMIVREDEGRLEVGDGEGRVTELRTADVVSRVPQPASVMPEGLAERMTVQEFRDLLAFLEGLR